MFFYVVCLSSKVVEVVSLEMIFANLLIDLNLRIVEFFKDFDQTLVSL
jgi:hypothetical protein